ncbi:Na+/H+ antiporter subunit C [Rheinheimera tilapiae]|jgi:multicomponent K+:H+ antiporter subunit C|uniref:Na+/H+ antiporter subunit C n=1 Tax=Rheinheimera tilapiae TaxID=875043 RepID=A0ABV6BEK3_9GAMM
MELLLAVAIGLLTGCGVLLLLRGRTFAVMLGLTMLSYAVNLFIFVSGGLTAGAGAVLGASARYADPLPQALVLTAIVIGFAMTAFLVVLAIRSRAELGHDELDNQRSPKRGMP